MFEGLGCWAFELRSGLWRPPPEPARRIPRADCLACLPDHVIAQQEVFGPVLSVLNFDDDEQAVEIANSINYGPSARCVP